MAKKSVSEKELTSRVIDLRYGLSSIIGLIDDSIGGLESAGNCADIFEEMLEDSRVSSLVENRQDKVLFLDMGQVDGEDEKINEAVREALNFNILQKAGMQLLNALVYGCAISEVVWERRNGLTLCLYPEPHTILKSAAMFLCLF